jgi:hypothetical protein
MARQRAFYHFKHQFSRNSSITGENSTVRMIVNGYSVSFRTAQFCRSVSHEGIGAERGLLFFAHFIQSFMYSGLPVARPCPLIC